MSELFRRAGWWAELQRGPLSITTAPQRLMVKARLRWVNVYPPIRKGEAHYKQEYGGQHGHGDNELLSASLPRPQPMLIRAVVMGRRVEWTQSSGSPLFRREKRLQIQNERQRINSKNIWTLYSNTLWIVLEAGGQRAVVENEQWRDGKDSQAVELAFLLLSQAAKMALIYRGTYW